MIVVSEADFKKEVLESKTPVVVEFFAEWCPPCKVYAPAFESAARRLGQKAKFIKVNVDDAIEVAKEYGVMSIPTTILFKNGKQIANFTGAIAQEDLEAWVGGRI